MWRTPVCLGEGKEITLQYTRDSGHRVIATGGEKQAVRKLFLGRVSWHLTSEYSQGARFSPKDPLLLRRLQSLSHGMGDFMKEMARIPKRHRPSVFTIQSL